MTSSRFLNIFAVILLSIGILTSCEDDRIYDPSYIGEGDAQVTANLTFTPLMSALGSRAVSGGTPGNAIKDINSVNIVIYNDKNEFVDQYYFSGEDLKVEDLNNPNPDNLPSDIEDYNDSEKKEHLAETATKRAVVKLNGTLPYGRYYMYAIANTTSGLFNQTDIDTPEKLKKIVIDWQENNIPANNQMFGYFSENNATKGFDASLVTVNRPSVNLHAWIKRAASKVTIAFDARNLKDNIYIFLKTAEIKDIPAHCYLGADNEPGSYSPEQNEMNKLIANGQTIQYVDDPTTTNYDESWTARLSKGAPIYGFNTEAVGKGTPEEQIRAQHGENVNALYFYENMQGEGNAGTESDKWQVVEGSDVTTKPTYPDGYKPDDKAYKDAKKYGSYIEVKAYYISNNEGDMSRGDITYRFMLGKDTHLNYDAERNHHYKLTMCFKGYANDVDWHIEYPREPGIVMPNPYYISYLYNHSMMLPMQINLPKDKYITDLRARIINNNWAPANTVYLDYWKIMNNNLYVLKDFDLNNKNLFNLDWDTPCYNYNGFLSLHATEKTVVTLADNGINEKKYPIDANKKYYNDAPKRGERIYLSSAAKDYIKTFPQDYPTTGAKPTDVFRASRLEDENGVIYKFNLPMYTRAKQLVKATAYTGNNPYVAYQREADVLVSATLNDGTVYNDTVTIKQVRRIVNPKGIYRKANNSASFNVVLKRLPMERSTQFEAFRSEGPWKAYVIRGSIAEVSSDDPNTTTKQETIDFNGEKINVKSVYGETGSLIDFDVDFKAGEGDAVIRVEYHNFSCYHLIFVKKGDQAVNLGTGTKWYTRNMKNDASGNVIPVDNPCEEGSLFKWNNWNGIDALKNKNNKEYWTDIEPDDFKKNAAASGNSLTLEEWNGITYYSTKSTPTFSNSTNGYKLATYKDYQSLYASDDIEYGYGVLYGDNCTSTLDDINDVYGYDYKNTSRGMRGCFVYNKTTGKHIFFPVGASGYGHRKQSLQCPPKITVNWDAGPTSGLDPVSPTANNQGPTYYGVLRYSCNPRWGYFNVPWGHPAYPQAVNDAPLFFDLFMRPGAIYWIRDRQEDPSNDFDKDEDIKKIVSWDFNYFTFDFYPLGEVNVGEGADACFIRCVE